MIGSIISGVAKIGSTIFGGIKAGQYKRDALKELEGRRKENEDWYAMKSAQNYTQRSDIQNILRKQKDLMQEQYAQAKAANVVGGGSEESLALQKEAANQAAASTMADIASGATQYKEGLEQQYRGQKQALSQEKQHVLESQAKMVAQAASQAADAAGSMGTGIQSWIDKKNK